MDPSEVPPASHSREVIFPAQPHQLRHPDDVVPNPRNLASKVNSRKRNPSSRDIKKLQLKLQMLESKIDSMLSSRSLSPPQPSSGEQLPSSRGSSLPGPSSETVSGSSGQEIKKLRREAAQIRMALNKAQFGVFASNGTIKSNNSAPKASAVVVIKSKDEVAETGVAVKSIDPVARASTVAVIESNASLEAGTAAIKLSDPVTEVRTAAVIGSRTSVVETSAVTVKSNALLTEASPAVISSNTSVEASTVAVKSSESIEHQVPNSPISDEMYFRASQNASRDPEYMQRSARVTNALYNPVTIPRYPETSPITLITSPPRQRQSSQQWPEHQAQHDMAGKRKYTTQIPAMGKRTKTAKAPKFFEEPDIIEAPKTTWISPITYADIHYHQQVAWNQNPPSNGPFLPEEVREELKSEWHSIIAGAFDILDSRLHCNTCSDRHKYLVLWDAGHEVKSEMEATEAENVKHHMIERWALRMKLIEDTYRFAVKEWHATGSTVKGKEVDMDSLTQEEIDEEFSLIAKSERERKARLEKEKLEKEQRERAAAPRTLDFLPPVTPYSGSSRQKKPSQQQAQLAKRRQQDEEDEEIFPREYYEALHPEHRPMVPHNRPPVQRGYPSQSSTSRSSIQHPTQSSSSGSSIQYPSQSSSSQSSIQHPSQPSNSRSSAQNPSISHSSAPQQSNTTNPPLQKSNSHQNPNTHTEIDHLILDAFTPASGIPNNLREITAEEILAEESEDEGIWIENGGYTSESESGDSDREDGGEDKGELERDLEKELERNEDGVEEDESEEE